MVEPSNLLSLFNVGVGGLQLEFGGKVDEEGRPSAEAGGPL